MRVPFDVSTFDNNGKKAYSICLSFDAIESLRNEDEVKSFYNFIENLDETICSSVGDNRKKLNLSKTITYKKTLVQLIDKTTNKKFPHFMNCVLPYNEKEGFYFTIFNDKGVEIKINNNIETILKKDCIITTALEVSSIKFSDKYYKLEFNILQIGISTPFSDTHKLLRKKCLLFNVEQPEIIPQQHVQIVTKSEAPPPQKQQSTNNMQSAFRPPTKDEIENGMKKLKKIASEIPPPPPIIDGLFGTKEETKKKNKK